MMKNFLMSVALVPVLAACASPANTYYTLSAPALPAAASMSQKERILVGPVSLPAAVDVPQLVVAHGQNELKVYEYQRWGGSLKSDIARIVAANLVRDLGTPNVWTYGQSAYAQADYQVFVDVQTIDSTLGQSVLLDVLWTVKPMSGSVKPEGAEAVSKSKASDSGTSGLRGDGAVTGRSLVREPVAAGGFDALVAAQSRAFGRVSAEIAQVMQQR